MGKKNLLNIVALSFKKQTLDGILVHELDQTMKGYFPQHKQVLRCVVQGTLTCEAAPI